MRPRVWTAGYLAWRYTRFLAAVRTLDDPVVVDVRWRAYSVLPMWRPAALRAEVPYVHIPAWGNPDHKRCPEAIAISDFAGGLEEFESLDHANVVLLCACADYDTCHRKALAFQLQARGYTVSELPQPATGDGEPGAGPPSGLELEPKPGVEGGTGVSADAFE